MEDNVIVVGNSPLAQYVAFGDESKFMDTLVYAFCLFEKRDLRLVESKLRKIKKAYGLPDDQILHMSVLMNKFQREKIGLGHLENSDIKSLVTAIIDNLASISYLVRYSYYTLEEKEQNNFEDDGSGISGCLEEKGILGILCQGSFAVDPNGKEGPDARNCEIIVSEEQTKTELMGERNRADRWFSGFSDVGAPTGYVYRTRPRIAKADEVELLQIADLFSYICSHAKSEKCNDLFYSAQLERVKIRVEINMNYIRHRK